MKIKLYSVKDALTGFKAPFEAVNDKVAVRMVEQSLQGVPKSTVYDYSLFYLGSLDDETGYFETDNHFIINCIDLIKVAVPSVNVEVKEEEKKESDV